MRFVVLSFLLLLLASVAWAEDWPQFRGARRDGSWREAGPLEKFPEGGPRVRWRATVGYGWSSPVIAQGRVLVSDALLHPDKTAEERVVCFDERTGAQLWVQAYAAEYPEGVFVPGQAGGPSATPIVDGEHAYHLGGLGDVYALETKTGAVRWHRALQKEYEIGAMQCRASPLIEGDRLVLFVGAKPVATVVALDKRTGQVVWKALDEPVSNSSPIVIEAAGRRQLIVWTCASVSALDPVSGKVLWREAVTTSGNDANPTPVWREDWLLIGGLMKKLDAAKPGAAILWPESPAAAKRVLSNTSTPLLKGDHVYSALSRGEMMCLEASTGKQVWNTDRVTKVQSGASVHIVSAGDRAYLFTQTGDLVLAELTPAGYVEIGRARVIEGTTQFGGAKCAWALPAFANGGGFVRNDGMVVCVEVGR